MKKYMILLNIGHFVRYLKLRGRLSEIPTSLATLKILSSYSKTYSELCSLDPITKKSR